MIIGLLVLAAGFGMLLENALSRIRRGLVVGFPFQLTLCALIVLLPAVIIIVKTVVE